MKKIIFDVPETVDIMHYDYIATISPYLSEIKETIDEVNSPIWIRGVYEDRKKDLYSIMFCVDTEKKSVSIISMLRWSNYEFSIVKQDETNIKEVIQSLTKLI